MKKFISMVMAAAMVVSLVPATAFAGSFDVTATAGIVNAWEKTEADMVGGMIDGAKVPELQLTVTATDYQNTTDKAPEQKFELTLDNADFAKANLAADVKVFDKDGKDLSTGSNVNSAKTNDVYTYTAVTEAEMVEYLEDYIAGDNDGKDLAWASTKPAGGENAPYVAFSSSTVAENFKHVVAVKYTTTPWVQYIAAVDAAATAGKIDGAGSSTFDIPANWKVATNSDGYKVLKHTGGMAVLLSDVTTALGGKTQADFAGVLNANYVAEVVAEYKAWGGVWVTEDVKAGTIGAPTSDRKVEVVSALRDGDDKNVAEITIKGYLQVGDVISVDLTSVMDKTGEGRTATVAVTDGDFGVTEEALVYCSIVGKVLKASVKKVVDVAEEEIATIRDLKVEAAVGNLPETITLKLSKGFEFVVTKNAGSLNTASNFGTVTLEDDDEIEITNVKNGTAAVSEIIIKNIAVEATTAKAGDVATIKVVAPNYESASVEVAKVIEYTVVMSVDEDADVPVIYSGVNVANVGINDDSDHMSLEVTIEETFEGAWDMDKAFTLSLPEGVYVTDVKVSGCDGALDNATVATEFGKAYIKGDHVDFEFAKRVFTETNPSDKVNDPNTMTFALELIADPGFVGDVTLKLEGAAVETQEEVIAKFVSPVEVKAEQNDVIIDYRFTSIDTDIVVTEAEAGLWDETMEIAFAVEKEDYIVFEDDAVFTVNAESDMEIEEFTNSDGVLGFYVTEESEEEAAVITISGIELFMQRNIPAGPYALEMFANTAVAAYEDEVLLGQTVCDHKDCETRTCLDVTDFETTVKEAWVNVVTAGRDKDDASFTTKVLVPVGESYLVAGETQHALDVPAYINAAGYTMLPVRAVAVALGIDNDAVQWDNDTKTVIIMYGQRVITMTAGQKVIYASGTAIPAKSAVEIVDGRAFLGLRDLATALGVTTVNYDAATKTASLN